MSALGRCTSLRVSLPCGTAGTSCLLSVSVSQHSHCLSAASIPFVLLSAASYAPSLHPSRAELNHPLIAKVHRHLRFSHLPAVIPHQIPLPLPLWRRSRLPLHRQPWNQPAPVRQSQTATCLGTTNRREPDALTRRPSLSCRHTLRGRLSLLKKPCACPLCWTRSFARACPRQIVAEASSDYG